MNEHEQLERLKKNMLALCWSLDDAPYSGVSKASILGARFAVNKVLQGTGMTIDDLHAEAKEKGWFTETTRR